MGNSEAALEKKGIVLRASSHRYPGSPIQGTFFIPFAKPVSVEWVNLFHRSLIPHKVVPKHDYKAAVDGIEFTCPEDQIPQYVASLAEYVDTTNATVRETAGERDRSSKRLLDNLKRHL